ncbi:MAG: molybdate ABC transporter substrate-binding protein [Oscillospiraceae bacterium]
MKRSSRILAILVMIALVVSMTAITAFAASTPTISVDGTALSISSSLGAPYIDSSDRLQAPIRAVSEALGATVAWDQSTSTATINSTVKVKIGASSITTAYGTITMDTSAVNKGGRIYVPVRFIANALGYDVNATTASGKINADIITKANLTIAAAASLKNAMTEIQALYLKEKPNSKLSFNFAASGTLQTQIEQGASVDVFFSAASSNMNSLKTEGLLVDSTVKNLLGNDVVLIVPKDSKLTIDSFKDVTGSSVKTIGIGEPASVPAGKYAQDVFTYYGVWDQVKAKAVFGTPVTQILTWVETGNVDCGVVYSTDAAASTKVKVITTALDESHTPIVYPAAVIKSSTHTVAAKDFVNFLSSSAAKAVFVKYGFSILK